MLRDTAELISEDEIGSLTTQSIGVVGSRQDQLRTIPEVQLQLALVGAIEPGVWHHRFQVRPRDVLRLFAAWSQIEALGARFGEALLNQPRQPQAGFAEPSS